MPCPSRPRRSTRLMRTSASGSRSRCAASSTPEAPPPTMVMERRGALIGPPARCRALGRLPNFVVQQFARAVAQLLEARLVEHIGYGIADVQHHVSDLACGLVAIVTGLVARFA